MEELKTCLYCGKEARLREVETNFFEKRFYVECTDIQDCGIRTRFCKTKEEAIKLWNAKETKQ